MSNLGVAFFIPFHELEPSRQQQCIFFTKKGARCKNLCEDKDNKRAVTLHYVLAPSSVSLEILQEYISCNCCRRAKHRDRIEDTALLTPLALRWYEEILAHDSNRSDYVTTAVAFESQQLRYDLRSREGNISTSLTTASMSLGPHIGHPPLSEFRPHIATPLREDSVFQKIVDPLKDRDFETGSLYIFDRVSSPGHVKIGWTARSVSGRLQSWSECGYTPNLIFEVSCIPHAQRVETLTHHELIKEWRRERMCKAPHCQKSHQEWFEIDQRRAVQVLSDWAEFMKRAKPYDERGLLKKNWRQIICMMDDGGLSVTAKGLLEHHEASIYDKLIPLDSQEDLRAMPKIKQEIGFADEPNAAGLEGSKKPSLGKGTQQIRQLTLDNEILSYKKSAPSKQLAVTEVSSLDGEKNLDKTPLLDRESVSRTESQTEALAHSLPRSEQILQKPTLSADLPLEGHQPAKVELVYEKVLPLERYPMREEVVPQILQPVSPTPQSTTVLGTKTSSQETKETLCSGGEESCTINAITESKTDGILADTRPPSVPPTTPVLGPATAALSATSRENAKMETTIDSNVSITTTTLPLDISGPSPKPEPPDSLSSSAGSKPQTDIAPNLLAQLDKEVLEKMISHSSPKREEVDAPNSIMERQQIVEKDEKTKSESDALDIDERSSEKKIKFDDQDEVTVLQRMTGGELEWRQSRETKG